VDLATAHSRAGQHTEGLKLLHQAVAIEERLYGRDHKNVADTLHNTAVVMKMLGREAEANKMLGRVLKNYRLHLAPDHPLIAMATHKMKPMQDW
jgi:hypothetical protein